MSEKSYEVDGQHYMAFNNGTFPNGTSWMIRWMTHAPNEDPDNDFKETLLTVQSTDPLAAIKAAIAQNSWG